MRDDMSPQYAFQILLFIGLVLSAVGTIGSYHYGKRDERQAREASTARENESREASTARENELRDQIAKFQNTLDTKTELILKSVSVKTDAGVWTAVTIDKIPPGVADYLMFLFVANQGRISGKVRVKGSENIAFFS